MRSPGRLASEQMAALVFPDSEEPEARPRVGPGAAAGAVDAVGASAAGAGTAAETVGSREGRGVGDGREDGREEERAACGDAAGAVGRSVVFAGAVGMEIAVSPIDGTGRAGALPAASVRSRESSESTAELCAGRSRHPAITNIDKGIQSAVMCRTLKRCMPSRRLHGSCRMVTTIVDGEMTNPIPQ